MIDIVEILWRRDHEFKAKDPKADKKLCVTCGRGRDHASLCHYGAPPSTNVGGSGHDHGYYQAAKSNWQKMLADCLAESGLDRGLQRVVVEGEVGFDTYTSRDEGNFRTFVEKALGDALQSGYWELRPTVKVDVEQERRAAEGSPPLVTKKSRAKGKTKVQVVAGGWLPSDSFFPVARYSFGHLVPVYTPGQSHLRLTLFPSLEAETVPHAEQERLAV